MTCHRTSISRIFSTSIIHREVIHAQGQTGSNQKSATPRSATIGSFPHIRQEGAGGSGRRPPRVSPPSLRLPDPASGPHGMTGSAADVWAVGGTRELDRGGYEPDEGGGAGAGGAARRQLVRRHPRPHHRGQDLPDDHDREVHLPRAG